MSDQPTPTTVCPEASSSQGRPETSRPEVFEPGVSRRTMLTVGAGAAAGLGLLAACGSNGSGSNGSGSTGSGGDATSGAGSGTTTGAAAASGIVALSSIPVGQAVAANLDGKPIVVGRPTDSTAVAFSAVCTHQGCTVNVNGATLNCPCHGSAFNALTGAVERGPATANLPAVAVSVSGGTVVAS